MENRFTDHQNMLGGGDIVSAFSEEAYWDLVAVEKLLNSLKSNSCEDNNGVFYLGRRTLYMLQQASEKTVKAYILGYFKPLLERLMLPKNMKVNRSRYPTVFSVWNLLKDSLNLITVEKIGHEPFIAVANIVCNLYKLFYQKKQELNDYVEFYVKSHLYTTLARLDLNQKKVDPVKKALEIAIESKLVQQITSSIASLELSSEDKAKLESVCSRFEKAKGREPLGSIMPPCIDIDKVNLLRKLRERYEEIVSEVKSQVSMEFLYNEALSMMKEVYRRLGKKHVVSSINELNLNVNEATEKHLKMLIEKTVPCLQDYIRYLSYIVYIIVYVLAVDPCLALYERLGRYPGRYPEAIEILDNDTRKTLCRDIQSLNVLKEEVEYMVNEVRKATKALHELHTCLQAVGYQPL